MGTLGPRGLTRRDFARGALGLGCISAWTSSGCRRETVREDSAQIPPAAGRQGGGRPNVVFILTDDQRWDQLGCAGHPFLKTPHLDRLAAEGARFSNMFVTTSLCSPSRASFLSGLYAHSHGVIDNFIDYPADLETVVSLQSIMSRTDLAIAEKRPSCMLSAGVS